MNILTNRKSLNLKRSRNHIAYKNSKKRLREVLLKHVILAIGDVEDSYQIVNPPDEEQEHKSGRKDFLEIVDKVVITICLICAIVATLILLCLFLGVFFYL